MKPQCETTAECLRELARVMDQFGIDSSVAALNSGYVTYDGKKDKMISVPFFNTPQYWQFAIAELEGKPVFIGDELYCNGQRRVVRSATNQLRRMNLSYGTQDVSFGFDISDWSWNAPKPKTIMVEMKEMNMDIKIEVEKNHDGTRTRVVGYVNGRDIVTVSNHIYGKWFVGSSTCLPSDMKNAGAFIDCMKQTFETAKAHGA